MKGTMLNLCNPTVSRVTWVALTLLLLASSPVSFCAGEGTVNPNDGPCIPRDFGRGSIVCVCNSTYCDALPRIPPPPATSGHQDEIHIFTSSKAGQRLHKSWSRFTSRRQQGRDEGQRGKREGERKGIQPELEEQPFLIQNTLKDNTLNFPFLGRLSGRNRISKFWLNRRQKYQTVIGFGGAFTDSAGFNIRKLSTGTQENLIKSYFGPDGAEYTMGRVPIGGTDFSTRPYTYDDREKEPDLDLKHFALQSEDLELKMPYIKRAIELTGGKLQLVASPWSAPVWMKSSSQLNGAGVLKKKFYQTWADYIVRFLDEYKKAGIRIWGITTGNEPMNGFIPFFPFNCMGWSASDMRDWIANNLGPTLKEQRSDLDVRIILFDDNKGGLPTWTKKILENNRSSQYVDGIGTHWYFDFITGSDVLSRTHKKYPEYFLIQTESCLGFTPWEPEKVIVGSWERAEEYLEAIIRDFKHWIAGWLDWNLALDIKGGPNWANLAADASIIVNPSADEFFKQPFYYAISHVSKFVPAGSVRIQMEGSRVPSRLHHFAFLRPDNATVIVFLNRLSYDVEISLQDEEKGTVFHQVPARSIQTLLYYS